MVRPQSLTRSLAARLAREACLFARMSRRPGRGLLVSPGQGTHSEQADELGDEEVEDEDNVDDLLKVF